MSKQYVAHLKHNIILYVNCSWKIKNLFKEQHLLLLSFLSTNRAFPVSSTIKSFLLRLISLGLYLGWGGEYKEGGRKREITNNTLSCEKQPRNFLLKNYQWLVILTHTIYWPQTQHLLKDNMSSSFLTTVTLSTFKSLPLLTVTI